MKITSAKRPALTIPRRIVAVLNPFTEEDFGSGVGVGVGVEDGVGDGVGVGVSVGRGVGVAISAFRSPRKGSTVPEAASKKYYPLFPSLSSIYTSIGISSDCVFLYTSIS